jgi:hypothetical protein
VGTDPNACHQVSSCDDGDGWPRQVPECCIPYTTREYERCAAIFTENYQENCPSGSSDSCCVQAASTYDSCMQGLLGGGTGGNTGTGGTGGAVSTGGAGGN